MQVLSNVVEMACAREAVPEFNIQPFFFNAKSAGFMREQI